MNMASILTNSSAMTALQTLRQVQKDLSTTQDRISTGLRVNNARENAAYWSIATTMRADVSGFKAVQDSLQLGSGTTNTASVAAKNIVQNLQTLQSRIITGETNGVNKSLIQDDVNQLVKLVQGAASDAAFNGDNLLKVTYANDGTAKDKNVQILSSLSRSSTGVDASYISFDRQDMQVRSILGRATIEQQVDSTNAQKASMGFDIGALGSNFIQGQNLGLGKLSFSFTTEAIDDPTGIKVAGQTVNVSVDLSDIVYDDTRAHTEQKITDRINYATANAVYSQLTTAMTAAGVTAANQTAILGAAPVANNGAAADPTLVSAAGYTAPTIDPLTQALSSTFSFGTGANTGKLISTVGGGYTATTSFTSQIKDLWVTSNESDAFGGLAELTQVDVVNNANASLKAIQSLIDSATSKATTIGSIENRVSVQNDFVSKLVDSMNSGIGSLVDANMDEESSRLQALQVQQQLATQALSIANQGPQNILSLFK
jgi:flagellin